MNKKIFTITKTFTPLEIVQRQNDVISIWDTHWNYEAFIKNLIAWKVIDDYWNWISKNKDLVLHWDILWDRNTWSLDTLLKVYDLQKQAEKQWGSITILAWNHDDFAFSYLWETEIAWGGDVISICKYNWQWNWIIEFWQRFLWNNIKNIKKISKWKMLSTPKDILSAMRKSKEWKKILQIMTNYKVLEQIDDTLYCHTDFTSEMVHFLNHYNIEKINKIYQKWLKDILIYGNLASGEFDLVRGVFLNISNRHYFDCIEWHMLLDKWINRIVHWHSDHKWIVKNIWWVEICSVDTSFWKRWDTSSGKEAIWIFKADWSNNLWFKEPFKY